MTDDFRYAAFISYSSKDSAFAKRLHSALENYGIPSSLGRFQLVSTGKKNRVYPVFRDREEMSAGELGAQIEESLRASSALIVVCSPDGAASPWVQKEIEFFAGLGRRDRIFAIIPSNAPSADAQGGDATAACFPPALRGDALAAGSAEPLAADARRDKDGFRNACLKIVAGLISVSPGQLIDRDRQRRRARTMRNLAVALVATIGLAVAVDNERSWRPAVDDFFNPRSHYDVVFEQAPYGVSAASYARAREGSEVFYNGVPVGSVLEINIDADDPRRVVAKIAVDRLVPIFRDSRAEMHVVGDPKHVAIILWPGTPSAGALEGGDASGPAPTMPGHVAQSVYDWQSANSPY